MQSIKPRVPQGRGGEEGAQARLPLEAGIGELPGLLEPPRPRTAGGVAQAPERQPRRADPAGGSAPQSATQRRMLVEQLQGYHGWICVVAVCMPPPLLKQELLGGAMPKGSDCYGGS